MVATEPTAFSTELAALEERVLKRGGSRPDAIKEANSRIKVRTSTPPTARPGTARTMPLGPRKSAAGNRKPSRPKPRLLTKQSVSDWMTGTAHPKDFDRVWVLIEVLEEWAGAPAWDTAKGRAIRLTWQLLWERPGLVHTNIVTAPRPGDRNVLPEPAGVPARPGLDSPLPCTAAFVGRARELDALDAAMAGPGRAAVQAVAGLGGIGKSTLVAHWAASRPHGHAPIRWITADSGTAVRQGLADLAIALLRTAPKAHPVETLAQWAQEWLTIHTDWLIVLDNVEDPADIAPLLQRCGEGRFVITTRLATSWQRLGADVVRLSVLSPSESLDLLTSTMASDGPRSLDGATELCTVLGRLPLALEQAAAYLGQNPLLTPRGYLQLLDSQPAAMLPVGGAHTPQDRTIARIWHITLTQIAARQPLAAEVLGIVAWYAPDHIPLELVEGLGSPASVAQALGLLNAYSMISTDSAARSLSVHRLVQAVSRLPEPTDPQRTPQAIEQARQRAVDALGAELRRANDILTDEVDWWHRGITLVGHAAALAAAIPPGTQVPNFDAVLLHAALQADSPEDVAFARRDALDTVEIHGPDAPETLAAHCRLGDMLRGADALEEALSVLSDTVIRARSALGRHVPITLWARLSHARTLRRAGGPRARAAVSMLDDVAELHEQILGTEDTRTLFAAACLAEAWSETGDTARAVSLLERIVGRHVARAGEAEPDALDAMTRLAAAYEADGRPAEAVALLRRVLDRTESTFGPSHYETLGARTRLATALCRAGDAPAGRAQLEAVATAGVTGGVWSTLHSLLARTDLAGIMFDESMTDGSQRMIDRIAAYCENLMGSDSFRQHMETMEVAQEYASASAGRRAELAVAVAITWSEQYSSVPGGGLLVAALHLLMAHTCIVCGKLPEAERVLERAQQLGAHDANVAAVRRQLDAAAARQSGDTETSAAMLREDLARLEADPGADAGHVATARQALASVLPKTDPRRIDLLHAHAADHARRFGPTHTRTFDARLALAVAHHDAEDLTTAEELARGILADAESTLGIDSYHAQEMRTFLAGIVWKRTGVFAADAIESVRRSVEEVVRLLGETSPQTFLAKASLGQAYILAGQPQAAIDLLAPVTVDCARMLGDGHESTLRTHLVLGRAYRCAGRDADAIALLQPLAADSEGGGDSGPLEALGIRNELAQALRKQGRAREALALLLALVEPLSAAVAGGSREQLTLDANIAEAYLDLGQHQEAISRFDSVCQSRAAVLGPEHMDTLESRRHHAWAIGDAGDQAGHLALLRPLIADCTRVLGADHPHTLFARHNEAVALTAVADPRAPETCAAVLADLARVLGDDHPATEGLRNHLAG
ncbi:tetratricopeptide repeat protein [Streptomyces spectabilis]|uniref:tetratricopeptide repeat protein n=1 Tax=Streptomyces spectabilis TaxID=68270 RepID=UPI00340C0340